MPARAVNPFLYWAPRLLGILYALFISVFALDVFGAGYSFAELSVALFMHLIPTIIVLLVLALAWRRERLGGVLFILLGLGYVLWVWEADLWPAYLLIAGPLVLTGILFLLCCRLRPVSGEG